MTGTLAAAAGMQHCTQCGVLTDEWYLADNNATGTLKTYCSECDDARADRHGCVRIIAEGCGCESYAEACGCGCCNVLAYQEGKISEEGKVKKYEIVRMYASGKRARVISRGHTLEEAQAWCRLPETSSSTCSSAIGKRRTKKFGAWFDGYQEEK